MTMLLNLLMSALSQGMLYAPMALGVFVTFRILRTPDLTVDGSFVFGMTVCAAALSSVRSGLTLITLTFGLVSE